MIDNEAPRFGLPSSLWIPIAAASVADLGTFVGSVLRVVADPFTHRANAVLIETRSRDTADPESAPLWKSKLAQSARERLFPPRQVWVHRAYSGYRQAYI